MGRPIVVGPSGCLGWSRTQVSTMSLFQDLVALYCVVISNDDVINWGVFGSMEPWVHSIQWGVLPNGVLTSVYFWVRCPCLWGCTMSGHSFVFEPGFATFLLFSQFRVIQPLPEATSEGIGIELSMRATYLLTQDTPLLIHVTLTMRLHHVRS